MGAYYFLMCLLPPHPSALGEPLPLPFVELSRMARRHIQAADEPLLTGQLSLIDAANFENHLQARDLFLEGGTLSREEIASGRNLPLFIRAFLDEKERGIRRPYPPDRLWELAYDALLREAGQAGCLFLLEYLPWEIELRDRLVALRLRERGEGGDGRLVLPEIRRFDFTTLLSQIEGEKNPLALERTLDAERIKRIAHFQGTDPFSLDALLAYLAGAAIYGRWERMAEPYDLNQYLYGGG